MTSKSSSKSSKLETFIIFTPPVLMIAGVILFTLASLSIIQL